MAMAVGAGWLMLAAATTSAVAEEAQVGLVFDRLDDPDPSQWARTGDVLRFRVRLEGFADEARLALAANPVEALSTVACTDTAPPGSASGTAKPPASAFGTAMPPASRPVDLGASNSASGVVAGSGDAGAEATATATLALSEATVTPAVTPTAAPSVGSLFASVLKPSSRPTTGAGPWAPVRAESTPGATPGTGPDGVLAPGSGALAPGSGVLMPGSGAPAPGSGVLAPGVTPLPPAGVARPAGAEVCSLGAVSGMRAVDVRLTVPEGVKEVVLAAVARVRNAQGADLQTISRMARTPVDPAGPPLASHLRVPLEEPQVPDAAETAQGQDAQGQAPVQEPTDLGASGFQEQGNADPGGADLGGAQGDADLGGAQGNADLGEVRGRGDQSSAQDPAGTEDFSGGQEGLPQDPGFPGDPGAGGSEDFANQDQGLADPGGSAADPSADQQGAAADASVDQQGTAADPSVDQQGAAADPNGQQPSASPSPGSDLAESGQVQGLWNDPQLRLPQAAPVTATPTPTAQPLGAPLPRQLAIANRKAERAQPLDLITGLKGLPLAAGGIAVLLGALWGVLTAQRIRIQRRSQSVP